MPNASQPRTQPSPSQRKPEFGDVYLHEDDRIAAAGLVVLHYDHDFDRIAAVTGQPTEWILPAGTVP